MARAGHGQPRPISGAHVGFPGRFKALGRLSLHVPRMTPTVSPAAALWDLLDAHPSGKDAMRMGITQAPPKARAVWSGVLRTPYGRTAPLAAGSGGC